MRIARLLRIARLRLQPAQKPAGKPVGKMRDILRTHKNEIKRLNAIIDELKKKDIVQNESTTSNE